MARKLTKGQKVYYGMCFLSCRGLRPLTLRRLVALDVVARYVYDHNGPAYQRWVKKKNSATSRTKGNFIIELDLEGFRLLKKSANDIMLKSDSR